MKQLKNLVVFSGLVLAGALFAAPEDPLLPIYVDPVNGSDDNNGYTWETAMKTISAANAKTEIWDYYAYRRCQIVLKPGTYVLDTALTLKPRTSIMGDPTCDRSATVLTAPEGRTVTEKFIVFGNVNNSFIQTVANLTVSNVVMSKGAPISCGSSVGTRWSKVISNVVFTCCQQSWNGSICSAGIGMDGCSLAVDCDFHALTNTGGYGSVAICRNGGWFRNCTIRDCYNSGNGQINEYVGTYDKITGRLGVESCVFTNNYAGGNGGCLFNVPQIIDCEFYDNVCGKEGGVAYIDYDSNHAAKFTDYYAEHAPIARDSVFKRNVSKGTGWGGVLAAAIPGVISNCTFEANASTGLCGVAYGVREARESTFTNNRTMRTEGVAGGALYLAQNTILPIARTVVSDCTFAGNANPRSGGAVVSYVPVTMTDSTFTGNSAVGNGGAVCAMESEADFEIDRCRFADNVAGADGGAVYDVGRIANSTFERNAAPNGGAAKWAKALAGIAVSNCVFAANKADDTGGAIHFTQYLKLDAALVADCVFTNNAAGGSGNYHGGGALYVWIESGTAERALTIRNSLFAGNELTSTNNAVCCGSGLIAISRKGSAPLCIENCTIVSNRVVHGSDRGALYVWPDDKTNGAGFTYVTNTVIAGNIKANGSYGNPYTSVYGVKDDMCAKVGHSLLHPKSGYSYPADVISTDTLPRFKDGGYVPRRGSPLRNAGVNMPWMTAAYDLQRDADGQPVQARIQDGTVDIGAYENAPSGLGLLLFVR